MLLQLCALLFALFPLDYQRSYVPHLNLVTLYDPIVPTERSCSLGKIFLEYLVTMKDEIVI